MAVILIGAASKAQTLASLETWAMIAPENIVGGGLTKTVTTL
jgi:hypothetical protein